MKITHASLGVADSDETGKIQPSDIDALAHIVEQTRWNAQNMSRAVRIGLSGCEDPSTYISQGYKEIINGTYGLIFDNVENFDRMLWGCFGVLGSLNTPSGYRFIKFYIRCYDFSDPALIAYERDPIDVSRTPNIFPTASDSGNSCYGVTDGTHILCQCPPFFLPAHHRLRIILGMTGCAANEGFNVNEIYSLINQVRVS